MIHLWVAMSLDSDNLRISLEQIHSSSLPNRVLRNQTESEQKKKREREICFIKCHQHLFRLSFRYVCQCFFDVPDCLKASEIGTDCCSVAMVKFSLIILNATIMASC